MRIIEALFSLSVLAMLVACAVPESHKESGGRSSTSGDRGVEEIYILRSLREKRSSPGPFCDAGKIGFTPVVQDRYSFEAVITRAPDGKVLDARTHDAGTLDACFDGIPGVPEANFYAEGVMAGIPATGKGTCTAIAADYPERGITSLRCFLVLSGLPPPYIAGVLTTNTVASRKPIGDQTDPPGYIQPSIATIRLWRKP